MLLDLARRIARMGGSAKYGAILQRLRARISVLVWRRIAPMIGKCEPCHDVWEQLDTHDIAMDCIDPVVDWRRGDLDTVALSPLPPCTARLVAHCSTLPFPSAGFNTTFQELSPSDTPSGTLGENSGDAACEVSCPGLRAPG